MKRYQLFGALALAALAGLGIGAGIWAGSPQTVYRFGEGRHAQQWQTVVVGSIMCGSLACDPAPVPLSVAPTIRHPATFVFPADQIDRVKPLLKKGDSVKISDAKVTEIRIQNDSGRGWILTAYAGGSICYHPAAIHFADNIYFVDEGDRVDIKGTVYSSSNNGTLDMFDCDITKTGGE